MRSAILSLVAALFLAMCGFGLARLATASTGTLEPGSGPTSAYSYTLQDLWNRLRTGEAGGQSAFTEPTSGPITGTMHTLNEIMAAAPAADHTNGATTADVALGKTFWGLRTDGGWGPLTGAGAPAINSASIPRTGQTPTRPVNPAPAGSDGALQRGVGWPSPRFTDNGNGTVTDGLTGLIWLQHVGCGGDRNWTAALDFVSALHDGWNGDGNNGDCGLSDGSAAGDWRLPNVRELQSLIDYGSVNLALPPGYASYFGDVQAGICWSSSTYAPNTAAAWYVYLSDGAVGYDAKAYENLVWPVRGG